MITSAPDVQDFQNWSPVDRHALHSSRAISRLLKVCTFGRAVSQLISRTACVPSWYTGHAALLIADGNVKTHHVPASEQLYRRPSRLPNSVLDDGSNAAPTSSLLASKELCKIRRTR